MGVARVDGNGPRAGLGVRVVGVEGWGDSSGILLPVIVREPVLLAFPWSFSAKQV